MKRVASFSIAGAVILVASAAALFFSQPQWKQHLELAWLQQSVGNQTDDIFALPKAAGEECAKAKSRDDCATILLWTKLYVNPKCAMCAVMIDDHIMHFFKCKAEFIQQADALIATGELSAEKRKLLTDYVKQLQAPKWHRVDPSPDNPEHYLATQSQRGPSLGGTYDPEGQVAIDSLIKAGIPPFIAEVIANFTNTYNQASFGLTNSSPTNTPGNRRWLISKTKSQEFAP